MAEKVLSHKYRSEIGEIGMNINKRDIHACQTLSEKDRAIVKFAIRKNCTNILSVKKDLKRLDTSKLS